MICYLGPFIWKRLPFHPISVFFILIVIIGSEKVGLVSVVEYSIIIIPRLPPRNSSNFIEKLFIYKDPESRKSHVEFIFLESFSWGC